MSLSSTGAAATAAVTGSPYAIIASSAVGSGLANYTISYVNGSLTVNPAPLTITANSMTKTYGQTATFAGTAFTTSGLVNSDTVSSVSLSSTGAAATATVAGSPYAIVASSAVGSGLGNYTISYVNGSLTVNPAVTAIATTPSATTLTLSASSVTLNDTAVLSGGYNETGTITFTLYLGEHAGEDPDRVGERQRHVHDANGLHSSDHGHGDWNLPVGFKLQRRLQRSRRERDRCLERAGESEPGEPVNHHNAQHHVRHVRNVGDPEGHGDDCAGL